VEYRKNIKATDKEMEKLFDNNEYNYLVKYYEKIGNGLFKAILRVPENMEFPKSNTISISTVKKILETKENLNPMYIEKEFERMKNKIYEFNQKKYPNYEDMDIKLMLSKINDTYDFNAINDIYDKIKESGRLEVLKKNIEKELDKAINTNEKDFKLQEETKMKLEKGNVIKTDLSDTTIVLDMDNKQKQAVLFTGTQFVIASGIKLNDKTGKFEWDNGRYANDIKTISDMKNNSFEAMKETVSFLTEYNHRDFVKAIISIETGIENDDLLDNIYEEYMQSDTTLVDEKFYEYVEDETLEKGIEDKEKVADNSKEDLGNKQTENLPKDQEKGDKPKDIDTIDVTGNIVKDVEVKELTSKDGNPFTVANFSVAENKDGEVKYTNCLAYNDKAEAVKDLKKGDFVKLTGQEKKTTGKDGKEYISLKVNEAKLLKAKQQIKQEAKEDKSSVIGKLNQYKQQAKEQALENVKKNKNVER